MKKNKDRALVMGKIILGCALFAVSFDLFLEPNDLNAGGVYYTGGEGWRGFHNEYDNPNGTPYLECQLHGSGMWQDEGIDDSDFGTGDEGFDFWPDGDG